VAVYLGGGLLYPADVDIAEHGGSITAYDLSPIGSGLPWATRLIRPVEIKRCGALDMSYNQKVWK
jgi:hypothetical protein